MKADPIIAAVHQAAGIAALVLAVVVLLKIFGIISIRADTMQMIGAGILCALAK